MKLFSLGWCIIIGSSIFSQSAPQKFRFEQQKMGTTFSLVFYHQSAVEAQAAATAAFAKVDELNKIFSDYDAQSEVSKLSKTAGTGTRVRVSDHLWQVLKVSQQISRKSHGAFDISVGPLTKLWRRAFRQKVFPQEEQINEAKALVNYKWIKLYEKSQQVELKKPGMKLDLGGIAKGYTVDQVFALLCARNITTAIVDGGGDLMIGAPPPEGQSWNIAGIANPPRNLLENRAIASSGATYRFLEWEGRRYSHIIDPRSGMGLEEIEVINIVAANCMLADALASTVSVTTKEASKKLLKIFNAEQISRADAEP